MGGGHLGGPVLEEHVPMPEVVSGGEGGGIPVPQPSDNVGRVEELSFQLDRGS